MDIEVPELEEREFLLSDYADLVVNDADRLTVVVAEEIAEAPGVLGLERHLHADRFEYVVQALAIDIVGLDQILLGRAEPAAKEPSRHLEFAARQDVRDADSHVHGLGPDEGPARQPQHPELPEPAGCVDLGGTEFGPLAGPHVGKRDADHHAAIDRGVVFARGRKGIATADAPAGNLDRDAGQFLPDDAFHDLADVGGAGLGEILVEMIGLLCRPGGTPSLAGVSDDVYANDQFVAHE